MTAQRSHLRPDGFLSRNDIELQTPLEKTLGQTIRDIEAAGAHPLLTEASVLVQQAKSLIADYVELDQ